MASKSSMAILSVLMCVALALLVLGALPGSSFLVTASFRASASPQVRELSGASAEPRRTAQDAGSALPVVGLAVLTGLIAATAKASRVQRRAMIECKWNDDPYMPGGSVVALTAEEEKKWLDEKCEQLEALMPMSQEELDDEVSEYHWNWNKHLLPYKQRFETGVGKTNAEKAKIKLRKIRKQPEFWKKLRVFKPIALKYPTLLRHFGTYWTRPRRGEQCAWRLPQSIEDQNFEMNASWLANEEKVAGFTYQDFLEETNGNKFDNWKTFAVGDIVPGKVVAINQLDALVDIGDKTWALLPMDKASLRPIGSMRDAGIELGMEIDAQIIEVGVQSKVSGDGRASQVILSTLDIQRVSAWDLVSRTINAEEGTNPIWKVSVIKMETWGAVVMTDVGLQGYIPNRELANKVGDAGLVGTNIEVNITNAIEENKEILQPSRPGEFPLVFSYKNIATRALSARLKEGMVVDAKITDVRIGGIEMEVDGYPCSMGKVEISAAPRYDLTDVFRTGEMIKVYVLSTLEKDGSIKFSTRALERKRGEIVRNKARVFANAEETAQKAFERFSQAKQSLADTLEAAMLDDGFGDDLSDGGSAPDKGKNMSDLMDEDGDEF